MRYGLTAAALLGATLTACTGGGAGDEGYGVSSDGGARDDGVSPVADLAPAGGDAAAPPVDSLDDNRQRLLATYLAYLQAHPGAQSNGLDGTTLASVCDLWMRLDPSARSVFFTLTARMQELARSASDRRSMLSHVTRLYRVTGGQNAERRPIPEAAAAASTTA